MNFFYTLQGEAAGAQAFSNFDTYLAPFIRYDNLNQKEVEQALQEFFFNMNVPTRVGFQTPFTNLTLDLTVPEFMRNEAVIYNGKVTNDTYGDMSKEMEMFNLGFAETSYGDYLDKRASEFGLTRKSATYASTIVTVNGTATKVVDEGTIFAGYNFYAMIAQQSG